MSKVTDLLNRYKNGLLTEKEVHEHLDTIEIRGAIEHTDKVYFIGYDYDDQEWIQEKV